MQSILINTLFYSTRKLSAGTSRVSEPPAARESLSQLSDLLEKGERKGLLTNRMPAAIERGIQEENLRFLENRDVFCDEYFKFIYEFLSCNANAVKVDAITSLQSVKLAVHFLCNSYFHLRHRQSAYMRDVLDTVASYMEKSAETTEWVLQFFASDGLRFFKPILLECTYREVRVSFASLVQNAFKFFKKHNNNTLSDHINRILSELVGFVENDVPNNNKNSGQFFWILSKFAQMVRVLFTRQATAE